MQVIPYRRADAAAYAERWALSRNPKWYNFDSLGGDCTNFISQCLYAGCGIMNETPETGWFYRSLSSRAPAWTGVQPLFLFLTGNRGVGPFAQVVGRSAVEVGDVIQLGNAGGSFYHSLLVLSPPPEIYVAAHTYDALWRPLDSYSFSRLRCLHILGARKPG